MYQQTHSARQAGLPARPRHGQSRARRHAARSRQQPAGAGDRRGPVIVVGYDATPQARAALAFAVRRAGPLGTVVAVYAVAAARDYLGRPYYDRAVEHAQRDGRAILDDAVATNGSVVETSLQEGRPAEVLGRLAQLRDAQEIVVGSRASGRRRRTLRRSVSRSLVATAGRPVVIVPAPPPA